MKPHQVHRIAQGVRDFGYEDATDEEVGDCLEALQRGDEEMPHGALGVLVRSLAES